MEHRSEASKNIKIEFKIDETGAATWTGLPISMQASLRLRFQNMDFLQQYPAVALRVIMIES